MASMDIGKVGNPVSHQLIHVHKQRPHPLTRITMKSILGLFPLLVVVCLALFTSSHGQEKCERSAYPPDKHAAVPLYEVDLDLSPQQRWAPLMKEKGPKIVAMVDDVKNFIRSVVSEKVYEILIKNLDKVATTLPYPFYEEMVGISALSGLPLSFVTLYNIFYEAFTLCTSIIAQDPSGHLYHGRNLDTGLFLGWDRKNHTWRVAEQLRPLTVQLDWKKNGTTLFRSISFAGYVGVLTAVRKDRFSLSVDKRFALNGGFMGLLEWILFDDHNQSWVAFLTREVMQEARSFAEAQTKLSKRRLLAPVYFILGGTQPGEGCIITRYRDNFDIMNLGSSQTRSGSWYLVQTNYDHWKNPPFFDDRRLIANQCMMESGQKNASLSLLYNVLSTKPILNKETVYSALMVASSGRIQAWTRECPDPCWPW